MHDELQHLRGKALPSRFKSEAPRTVLFLRDFQRPSGGHLKVWHYFQHVGSDPGFKAKVYFTPTSVLDASNPWISAGVLPEPTWQPALADALFLGGVDWRWIDANPASPPGKPVLNIIQHLRHADPADPRFAFLARRAIRLCVNPLIADALRRTGRVRGPVIDVPMGVDVVGRAGARCNAGDVVIAALKAPDLGRALASRLEATGVAVRLLDSLLPRHHYLEIVSRSRVLVCLPNPREGFYLPALEGMAMGRIVVCPDCEANRIYLRDGENGYMPDLDIDAIEDAVRRALAMPPQESRAMEEKARNTASGFPPEAEREAFLRALHDIESLWAASA